MDRKTARANAMKLIYEWDMGGEGGEQTRVEMLETDEPYVDFMNELTNGVIEHAEELDERISKYLRNWTIERLSKVDLAILRLGAWELQCGNTPPGVVINEAVELAKAYSEDRAGAFVNGVLGSLSREINNK